MFECSGDTLLILLKIGLWRSTSLVLMCCCFLASFCGPQMRMSITKMLTQLSSGNTI